MTRVKASPPPAGDGTRPPPLWGPPTPDHSPAPSPGVRTVDTRDERPVTTGKALRVGPPNHDVPDRGDGKGLGPDRPWVPGAGGGPPRGAH